MPGKIVTIDGNTAATHVAYALSEAAAIYPITPSTSMGEYADEWAGKGRKNIFGLPVDVVEMQSEAGVAGAVHGSLSAGALTTTFTAAQGLLLMIPNMYKIAGEMLPTVFHVSARSLACQSLSIFGDQSDVMSVRNTGFALLASASVQEVMDFALVAHLSTLKSQIPFLHFFDGFRTSHEVQKVEEISYEDIAKLVEHKYIENFRKRAMRPDAPFVKVGAQNPDVYFQGRESINKYYADCPKIVKEYMEKVGTLTGRKYKLFDYVGAPDAKKIIVAMCSVCSTIEETVNYLVSRGNKVGAVLVRLYRPFSVEDFKAVLPKTIKKIAVLDRTKEPGAIGEPLYQDIVAALKGEKIKIIGGRYGLSSKEITPSMINAVYEHLDGEAFHSFTVGIEDDISGLSIPVKRKINTEPADVVRCIFWGLGSDGTVGANKNSIKIIGDNTDMYAQGYFVYDSKKSFGITISHLRFGKSPIKSAYLVDSPNFVACHNPAYIGRYDMLESVSESGVFLLNSRWNNDEVFNRLTRDMQQTIKKKKLKFYNIDALKISMECGLGRRINTVMMTAFFLISGVLERDKAIQLIKEAIKKTYSAKGEDIVKMNWLCVDKTSEALQEIKVPAKITKSFEPRKLISENTDNFAKKVVEPLMRLKGDSLPVSAMSFDGVIPTGTAALEKRGIAPRVPKWMPEICIQCNMCVMACPHAVIRAKQIFPEDAAKAPPSFKMVKSKTKNDKNLDYRLQIYVDDCTGCGVCVETCPAKPSKALEFTTPEEERANGQVENYKFFENLPDNVFDGAPEETLKGLMFKKPLFEFSGACGGCGETPYIKLLTQLCGDKLIIANATGCSSIYGGTFPTTPYCKTKEGRGPVWANSLFEDNAEYGFGMRLAVDNNRKQLRLNLDKLLEGGVNQDIFAAIKHSTSLWNQKNTEAIIAQEAVKKLLPKAIQEAGGETKAILDKIAELSDYFVDKSVWCIGGDGWAYDIGFGGLDHVVAMNRNVKILVLDTEIYSNTGGQASKSTPIGAIAKFASAGKRLTKKNLGFMCMSYGYVYVASVAMGANRVQTINAFREAEEFNGSAVVIAYSPCIAHGIDMMKSQTEEKRAVDAGYWPLYRYNPAKIAKGEPPFIWESKDASLPYQEFIKGERRYSTLLQTAPQDAEKVFRDAEADAKRRMEFSKKLGSIM